MVLQLVPLICGQRECGEHIAMTKKKYYWAFRLNQEGHSIQLYFSILNGKKKLLIDQKQVSHETNSMNLFKRVLKSNFSYQFRMRGFEIRIEQNGVNFDCFVEGTNFKDLVQAKKSVLKGEDVGINDACSSVALNTINNELENSCFITIDPAL